jgi:hypothetical protein
MHAEALAHIRQIECSDLVVLLGVVNGAHAALKRDDSGDWIIAGSSSIWSCNGMFSVHVACQTRRRWRFVKQALDFCDRIPAAIGLRQTRSSAAADHLNRPPYQEGAVSAKHQPKFRRFVIEVVKVLDH